PEEAVSERPTMGVLQRGPGLLDENVVLHARWAGGHAGHAPHALVEVTHHRGGERNLGFPQPAHEVDATAWAVHLLAPALVGRAVREAEAAVHAVVDEVSLRH